MLFSYSLYAPFFALLTLNDILLHSFIPVSKQYCGAEKGEEKTVLLDSSCVRRYSSASLPKGLSGDILLHNKLHAPQNTAPFKGPFPFFSSISFLHLSQ